MFNFDCRYHNCDPSDRKRFCSDFDSRTVLGKTWKGANPKALGEIRELLIRRGAVEDKDLRNPHEAWRVRIEKSVFTGYRSGTIYCNGGGIPELAFLYKSISEIVGSDGPPVASI